MESLDLQHFDPLNQQTTNEKFDMCLDDELLLNQSEAYQPQFEPLKKRPSKEGHFLKMPQLAKCADSLRVPKAKRPA